MFPTDGLPLDQAALVEFLAIGAHAARRAEIQGGERTLVVGAGPIGIATALFARARGAQVTFLDPRADRLAFCRDVLALGDGLPADGTRASGWPTSPAAICSTSSSMPPATPRRWSRASAGSRMAARWSWSAWCATDVRFSDPDFHRRELTLKASRNATIEDFREVLGAIRSGARPGRAADHASRPPGGGARALSRVDPARDRRRQGDDRVLRWRSRDVVGAAEALYSAGACSVR